MTFIIKELKSDTGTEIIYKDGSIVSHYHRTSKSRREYLKKRLKEKSTELIALGVGVLFLLSFLSVTLPPMINTPSVFLVDPELGVNSDLTGWGWLFMIHSVLSLFVISVGIAALLALDVPALIRIKREEVEDNGDACFFDSVRESSDTFLQYIHSASDQELRELIEHSKNYKAKADYIKEIEDALCQDSSAKTHHLRKDLENKLEQLKSEQEELKKTSQKYRQKMREQAEELKEQELSEKYLNLLAA